MLQSRVIVECELHLKAMKRAYSYGLVKYLFESRVFIKGLPALGLLLSLALSRTDALLVPIFQSIAAWVLYPDGSIFTEWFVAYSYPLMHFLSFLASLPLLRLILKPCIFPGLVVAEYEFQCLQTIH
jgi:hypothetical protein